MNERQQFAFDRPCLFFEDVRNMFFRRDEPRNGVILTTVLTLDLFDTGGMDANFTVPAWALWRWHASAAIQTKPQVFKSTDQLSYNEKAYLLTVCGKVLEGVGDQSTDMAELHGFSLHRERKLTSDEINRVTAKMTGQEKREKPIIPVGQIETVRRDLANEYFEEVGLPCRVSNPK